MEKVSVWYATDSDKSGKIIQSIKGLGLSFTALRGLDLGNVNMDAGGINVFIFDLYKVTPSKIIAAIEKDSRLHDCVKLVVLDSKELKETVNLNFNFLHMEFITRPLRKRDFLLLLEKTIVVEQYREIMKHVSRESESRIEAFEGLMDINRNGVFESEHEKTVFENILVHEKNILKEQSLLNEAIRGFTMLRQSEFFDLKNRIRAEEMLADLRRMELLDARHIIEAQEAVIDFSARQLNETQRILKASESVAELSRTEAIQLHDELKRSNEINKSLSEELQRLLKELDMMKKRFNES